MTAVSLKSIVEGLLFVADEPLSPERWPRPWKKPPTRDAWSGFWMN
jgi:hypothetical protein